MAGGYFAFQFLVTLYLQDSLGWSPLSMALGFLPAGLLVIASSTRMDRVLARVSTQALIATGMLAFLAAYTLFLRVDPGLGYVALLLPTMLLLGVGFATAFPSINAQATAGVAAHEQGLASGLVQSSFQVGGAVVLAIVSAVVSSRAAGGNFLDALPPSLAVVTGVAVLGLGVAASGLVGRREPALATES